MKPALRPSHRLALALCAAGLAVPAPAQAPQVEIPKPGVPQIMTLEGRYIRVAYNNEGYVILGYRLANLSVGEKVLMLEVGMTLRDGVKDQVIKREAISLDTPDGTHIPLMSTPDYRKMDVRPILQREKVQRDSINYFPPNAYRACRIGFFAELDSPAMVWDEVELSEQRACLGRLFFAVPAGIAHGQHWLNVDFATGPIRVPFRILTKDEDKMLEKNFKSIKKQVEEAFKKKGN